MNEQLEKIKKDTGADEVHLLIPTVSIEQINPYYQLEKATIKADIGPNSSDIFQVGSKNIDGKWEKQYSLCKPFLEKLAAAAGISMNPMSSTVSMTSSTTFEGHVDGAIVGSDGIPRLISNCKIIDMKLEEKKCRNEKLKKIQNGFIRSDAEKVAKIYKGEWKDVEYNGKTVKTFFIAQSDVNKYVNDAVDAALTQLWKDAPQKAFTGAWLRLIRSALGMKGTYTQSELKKPFVVTRLNFKPDFTDPAVKKMAL